MLLVELVVELVVVVVGGVAFTVAPGAEENHKATALSETNKNGHFRRQIQSSLASERSILEPKGTKKHPRKI